MSRLCLLSILASMSALTVAVAPAHADQCQLLSSPEVAARAATVLREASSMLSYCEPCGERAPGPPAPVPAGEVAVVRQTDGWAVRVQGQELDLAYRYVQREGGPYQNLAVLAGCPVHGVSPSLRVAPATATGVLIYGEPGVARVEPSLPVTSATSISAPVNSAPVNSAPGRREGVLSALWLVLGGLGAMLSAALALRATRQPVHTPRALALLDAARASSEHERDAREPKSAASGAAMVPPTRRR